MTVCMLARLFADFGDGVRWGWRHQAKSVAKCSQVHWRGRWDEGAGFELRLAAVAANEPHGELTGDLEAGECHRKVIEIAMDRLVAVSTKLMKQRHRLAWHIARPSQLTENIHEAIVGRP